MTPLHPQIPPFPPLSVTYAVVAHCNVGTHPNGSRASMPHGENRPIGILPWRQAFRESGEK